MDLKRKKRLLLEEIIILDKNAYNLRYCYHMNKYNIQVALQIFL